MNQIAKKLLLCVGILSVTMVSGCSSDDSSKKKVTAKNEEKTEVKMVANDLYVEPLNPTRLRHITSCRKQLPAKIKKKRPRWWQ